MEIDMRAIKFMTFFMATIAVAVVIMAFYFGFKKPTKQNVEVGQVWEKYWGDENDPFDKHDIEYRRVIAIEKGYVQFVDNDSDTSSRSIDTFTSVAIFRDSIYVKP